LKKNGTFSVKSTYNALTNCDGGQPFKHIWKSKIPAKIKIFLWLVANEAILTKDNLLKRRWRGDPLCYFCHQPETTNHLLFTCSTAKVIWSVVSISLGAANIPTSFEQSWRWCARWLPNGNQFHATGIAAICWAIWKMRNQICFDRKKFHNPLEIISHACALMKHWAGLQTDIDKEALVQGAEAMFQIAVRLLAERQAPTCGNKLLHATNDDDADQELEE
jgi:hypothetical protein